MGKSPGRAGAKKKGEKTSSPPFFLHPHLYTCLSGAPRGVAGGITVKAL